MRFVPSWLSAGFHSLSPALAAPRPSQIPSAVSTSPITVAPAKQPTRQTPALKAPTQVKKHFYDIGIGSSRPPPSLVSLQQKLELCAGTAPQCIEEQCAVFEEYVQQLSEHLSMLHLSPGSDPRDRRDLANYAERAVDALHSSLNNTLSILENKTTAATGEPVSTAISTLEKTLKQLDTVLKHTQLDNRIEDLKNTRQSLGITGWAGPVLAASIPQFLASLTHLGYARSASELAANVLSPANTPSAFIARSIIIGTVSGIAHESVNCVVKPAFQFMLQLTSLADKANMVGLKAVDAKVFIPDPLPFELANGELKKRSAVEMRKAVDEVTEQRARFSGKKALGTTSHSVGELVPYTSFGGAHAIRQFLNDLDQISGTTLNARAVTSGLAGAVSAGVQTAVQLGATFTDAQGRSFPIHELDRTTKSIKTELSKTLDPRLAEVRTAFSSKIYAGMQSVVISSSLPSAAVVADSIAGAVPSPLTAAQIVNNAFLAAAGSVAFLSTLFANQSSGAETVARRGATKSPAAHFDRVLTAQQNVFNPDRADLPHLSSAMAARGVPRAIENATYITRGTLQILPQTLVAVTSVASAAIIGSSSALYASVSDGIFSRSRTETTPSRSTASGQTVSGASNISIEEATRRMSDMEEGKPRDD